MWGFSFFRGFLNSGDGCLDLDGLDIEELGGHCSRWGLTDTKQLNGLPSVGLARVSASAEEAIDDVVVIFKYIIYKRKRILLHITHIIIKIILISNSNFLKLILN